MVSKTTRDEREEKLKEIIYDMINEEITSIGLVEKANDALNSRARLTNSKQLGSCLKVVMSQLDDVVLEKKVLFLSPSSSSVRYVFKKVEPSFKQELLRKKEELQNNGRGVGS